MYLQKIKFVNYWGWENDGDFVAYLCDKYHNVICEVEYPYVANISRPTALAPNKNDECYLIKAKTQKTYIVVPLHNNPVSISLSAYFDKCKTKTLPSLTYASDDDAVSNASLILGRAVCTGMLFCEEEQRFVTRWDRWQRERHLSYGRKDVWIKNLDKLLGKRILCG